MEQFLGFLGELVRCAFFGIGGFCVILWLISKIK